MTNFIHKLKSRGVLGMNRRNLEYIMGHNKRCYYPRADNKLISKRMASTEGIPVPQLYHCIDSVGSLKGLPLLLEEYGDFVLKPACGSGGEGIVVIEESCSGRFRGSGGKWFGAEEICYHAADILSGLYSLGGQLDAMIVEYRVRFDPIFEDITCKGVPDIRVVVYRGIPVMGMLRLPTRLSGGRANLHQGAVGVGVCMASGETLCGVWKDGLVSKHPDTKADLADRVIPHWTEILEYASKCCVFSALDYIGADFVLDEKYGPLLLEINARPGLAVQIANAAGLCERLEKAERARERLRDAKERAAFAREAFC